MRLKRYKVAVKLAAAINVELEAVGRTYNEAEKAALAEANRSISKDEAMPFWQVVTGSTRLLKDAVVSDEESTSTTVVPESPEAEHNKAMAKLLENESKLAQQIFAVMQQQKLNRQLLRQEMLRWKRLTGRRTKTGIAQGLDEKLTKI